MAHLRAAVEDVEANLADVRSRIEEACVRSGRDPASVEICVATKYVDAEMMPILRQAGLKIAAENRLQDMVAKQEQFGDEFEWHFIGAIQSRKMPEIASRVSVIHSLASKSASARLADLPFAPPRVLVQVNISGEESKQGLAPDEIDDFIADCPVPVTGLMTMPPAVGDPEEARPYFAQLARLASERGLAELSMGTSQDFCVAIEEGATLVRIGSVLFAPKEK